MKVSEIVYLKYESGSSMITVSYVVFPAKASFHIIPSPFILLSVCADRQDSDCSTPQLTCAPLITVASQRMLNADIKVLLGNIRKSTPAAYSRFYPHPSLTFRATLLVLHGGAHSSWNATVASCSASLTIPIVFVTRERIFFARVRLELSHQNYIQLYFIYHRIASRCPSSVWPLRSKIMN